jgi:5-methylcytosine-specific restriction endonuclease McrA
VGTQGELARRRCAFRTTKKLGEPVLVLNGNFEPVNVCNTKRAMGLILTGKATVVENGRGFIRTVSRTYERPSVIRLGYMVRRPRPRVRLCKREILRRDGYRCQYCGQRTNRLTIDHVIPRHRGGEYRWENLVAACPECNRLKGGRSPAETSLKLQRRPFEPRPTAEYIFGRYAHNYDEWSNYLAGW